MAGHEKKNAMSGLFSSFVKVTFWRGILERNVAMLTLGDILKPVSQNNPKTYQGVTLGHTDWGIASVLLPQHDYDTGCAQKLKTCDNDTFLPKHNNRAIMCRNRYLYIDCSSTSNPVTAKGCSREWGNPTTCNWGVHVMQFSCTWHQPCVRTRLRICGVQSRSSLQCSSLSALRGERPGDHHQRPSAFLGLGCLELHWQQLKRLF